MLGPVNSVGRKSHQQTQVFGIPELAATPVGKLVATGWVRISRIEQDSAAEADIQKDIGVLLALVFVQAQIGLDPSDAVL